MPSFFFVSKKKYYTFVANVIAIKFTAIKL